MVKLMGKLESAVRKQVRRTRINTAIIKTLAVGGMLTVALMAPNALQVLKQFGLSKPEKKKQGISRSVRRLLEGGYIKETSGQIELTLKGEHLAALLGEGRLVTHKPRRWDGKWRVLIFDIPERRRRVRDQIRHTLMTLGFVRLQNSVWVHPYDHEDLITLLKTDFHIGRDVLYLIADIEDDRPLRKAFNLDRV